jgi:hypothetical protein
MQEFQYVQSILKEWYTPVVVNQIPKKSPLWAIIKKKISETDAGGKRVYIPLQTGMTEAVGARAANDYSLPNAQRNTYNQAYIYLKRMYGRVMVDGYSIKAAKGKGGWIDILTGETKSATDAFSIDLDRQLMGRGNGVLALAAGAASGQTVEVDTPGGIVGDTPVTKWLRKGQVVDFYKSDGTQHAVSVVISGIDPATGIVTFVGDVSAVIENDILLKEKTFESVDTLGSGELMGIDGIIDVANTPGPDDFEGVDRDDEALFQAQVATSAGLLSETLIQEFLDQIDDNTDVEDGIDFIFTSKTIRNKLISLMQAFRKLETVDFKAGWKAVKYLGGNVELPILTHKNMPVGYMYFICKAHLRIYMLQQLTWNDDGGGIVKPVSGYDAFESWFSFYANFGSDSPNSMGKMTGVTVSE